MAMRRGVKENIPAVTRRGEVAVGDGALGAPCEHQSNWMSARAEGGPVPAMIRTMMVFAATGQNYASALSNVSLSGHASEYR
jgi:hypothetical protein